ncbi:DMSO/selenate family reductase complex A subunit [Cellulomonas denverensis]|uniref:Molybdopterin-dependent oxidoreductase n=1 Tax=Cellulomonas denverensis TaxID=264297 RepID=A0A7X6KVI2_9CELL|nr:DMSO/selenate family reductase complex A subunit [Cellulomonas denverensis]NKY23039.1 molybdopterin-dependent oxidoreductase [Cellulomonas denverensis]GIG23881.1 anaerobic dimethyl sulfoxide reductase subunit A [Cellulomonas denverensis]
MTDTPVLAAPVTRRSFVKWSAAAGGAVAVAGGAAHYGLLPISEAGATPRAASDGSRQVWSACMVNCGSRCPLLLTVQDGRVTRVDADPTGDDAVGTQQIRACVRGRAVRQRIYATDRLRYPMRRVGPRGSGEFERISWEEAFQEVAERLTATLDTYGNEAVYLNYGTGVLGATVACSWPPASTGVARLMNLMGGYLNHYSDYSTAQITSAYPFHYGGWTDGNSFDDLVNTKLFVMFGNNPHETRMSGGGDLFTSQTARREAGIRTIVIDPRYTDTAVTMGDEWVPIRPNTDAALVAGLAHVMIDEDLHDQEFLDRYCVGFDEDHLPAEAAPGSSYRAYVLGEGPDGVAKTPQWAAGVTGIPADTIVRLAREIALTKPCCINQGWGPQRHHNGENSARAVFTLAAMIGQIGIPGGGTGGREGFTSMATAAFPTLENPVETSVSNFNWTDAIYRWTEMTATSDGIRGADRLTAPIRFIWQYAGNALVNQHGDINRTGEILAEPDDLHIVVIESHMTVSARYADILLPDAMTAEQVDLGQQQRAGNLGYLIFADRAIDPPWECRPVYEILTGIAAELGVEDDFTEGKSQEDWVREIVAETRELSPGVPAFDEFRRQGIYKETNPDGPLIPLRDFREDPEANPLDTPSGKIEIYSQQLQEIAETWTLPDGDRITALPEYVESREGPEDPLREVYPLQMIGHHYKSRTHSSYGNVPWLQEAHPQQMWMHPTDADARGIGNGDTTEVFNDRGRIRIRVRVTPRIAPGVVSVPQGAWFDPDADGVDVGGSTNTLTSLHPSPLAKGNAQHTNLVQVERV